MSLADGCHQRPLQSNLVFVDGVYGSLRNAELAVGTSDRRDVHSLPHDRYIGGREYLLHGGGYLRSDPVAGNQGAHAAFATVQARQWCAI